MFITKDLQNNIRKPEEPRIKPNVLKVDWIKFKNNITWEIYFESANLMVALSIIQNFHEKIRSAAHPSKPKIKIDKFFPEPRWNKELQDVRRKKEIVHKIYRKTSYDRHLIAWKKTRCVAACSEFCCSRTIK